MSTRESSPPLNRRASSTGHDAAPTQLNRRASSTGDDAAPTQPHAALQTTTTMTEGSGDSPNHAEDGDTGRHGFSRMAHHVAFLSRLVTHTQPPHNSSDVELGVGEIRERRQSMQSSDERESIHAASAEDAAEDVPVVALRQRAPTSHQVRNDIMDEVDNETAHYAVVMVRKIEADVSVEELRLDDMNFEEIVLRLNQSQESSRQLFQLRDDEASQCIDINQYPLDVRYRVESTVIPAILNRHGGGGKSTSLAIKVVSKKSGWYDFVDGGRCMIEFSGSDKEAVKSAYLEVKQFVDYSVRTERPAFVRDLDFHDMLSFSDIEANMLNERLNVRPFFKIRKGTVLFSFGTLRGIIGHSPVKLYLLFGLGDGPCINPRRGPINEESIRDTVGGLQTAIEQINESKASKSLDHHHHQQHHPEFIAYNAILSWTNSAFLGLVADLEGRAVNIIEQFKARGFVVSNDHFEDLQKLSKDLEECGKSLSAHRRCLEEEVLNDQVAMAMMSLSYLRSNPSLYKTAESNTFAVLSSTEMLHNSRVVERIFVKAWEKVTGFEARLERLSKDVEDAHYKVKKADKDVQTTVLVVNTAITVLSTCIGFSGYITGAFGMNLDQTVNFPTAENPIQLQKGNFQNICVATFLNVVLGAPLFLYILVSFHLLPTTFSTKPAGSGSGGGGKSRRGWARLRSLGLSKHKSK